MHRDNQCGIKGVCLSGPYFKAYVTVEGKSKQIGKRKDFFEACCLVKSADAKKLKL